MEYKRKVDKKRIPTCNIMGVNIAAINMEWLVDYLEKNISEIKGDYICVSNVHTTVTSFDDADYCAIQNGGLMAIPDGGPLSTVGQKRGHKNMERTTGPSLMGEIFEISAKKGYRHYFYGSKEETLELLYQKLTSNYPGIQIAGMYSPPFRPLTEEEDKAIIERINETKPDFVWVGIGAPKQEKWMAAHQGKIDGLMLGVGAGFDYYAENIKRAPMWMQKHNLEWVYRLVQDPKRLFKRYWSTNTKFIWNARVRVLKDISQLKKDATPIDASNPHGKKQKAGKFTSVAKFGYYFLDFLIGNVKIAIAKIKSTLVLVERYYYDYSIDKVRYNLNLSDKFLSFFEHFVLKPDVIFILTGDSKKLLDRKHEITIDEIDEQKRKLNERFINNPKAVFIDTTEGTVDECVNKMLKECNAIMRKRRKW